MNITINAGSLDWKTDNKGKWSVVMDDLDGGTPVFSEGYEPTVSGRKITILNASRPSGLVTYQTDLADVVSAGPLYGAGSVSDSLEAISGDKTVRMGSVDLGTLTWTWVNTETYGYWSSSSIKSQMSYPTDTSVMPNIIADKYIPTSRNSLNGSESAVGKISLGISGSVVVNTGSSSISPTGMFYFERTTPVTSTETSQSLSLMTGDDTLSGGSFDTVYEGTDYAIPLIRNCKYLHRSPDGTESLVTGSTTNTSIDVKGGESKLVNLTHWFGRNREPSIADFYKLYPTWKTYDIPYDQGSVLNYKGTGIETIGFNAYDHSTGTAALLGGNKYQICGTYTSVSYVDIFGNTETLSLDGDGCFTPVNDGTLTVTGGNGTDTCVHLVWSGYKNYGEQEYKWEPFTRNVKELPISTYFPEGMNGIGDVSDELTSEQAIQRCVKHVFDGTETFAIQSTTNIAYAPGNRTKGAFQDGASNIDVMFENRPVSGVAIAFGVTATDTNIVFVGAKAVVNEMGLEFTVDNWKACLKQLYDSGNPIFVIYPLATPVVTQIDQPLNLAYHVNDFGTEHSLPQNTTTLVTTDLKALIKYNTDYMRMNSQLSGIFPTVKSLVQQEQDGHIMKKDDTAPKAIVGGAYNLIDRNAEGTERQFSFDTAGGSQDITDGTAVAQKGMGTTLNLNQLVHDTNENTVESVDGNATVEDAVAGQVKHLVVSGDTVVINQLVHEHVEKTESGTGRIWIKDAYEKPLTRLLITAPESVAENGLVTGVTPAFTLNGASTAMFTVPQELLGTASVKDDYEAVEDKFTRRLKRSDMSALTWTGSSGGWSTTLSDIKQNTRNILTGNAYEATVSGTTLTIASVSTPTGDVIYEVNAPVETVGTARTINLVSHDNTIFQTSGDLQSGIEATYDGLNQIIELDSSHTYIFNHNFVDESLITEQTSIEVVGGEDMLVDLTQLYNGDTTRVENIHSWASLSSRIHMYRNWIPYNPGEIVNLAATIRVYQHEHAYGVIYDPSQSSPVCQRVELNDGVLTEVESFTSLSAHEKFYRCVMDDLSTRHIAYYLDDTDSTKKYNGTRNGVTSDGTSSVLTGADGDVMVEIPITYWNLDEDYNGTGKILWLVSDTPFTGSEIHDFFYVSPNGDEARAQYVGAYRAVVADAEGNALNTTEGAISQNSGTASTRLLRSVAGALPFNNVTLASMREAAVRNGGSHVNRLFHEYLLMMMIIEQASLNCQSISMGYSNGKTNALWAWRKSGRTNYGNGTGQTMAVASTSDDDNFYSLKVNNVQLYRDANRDADGYFAWSNHAATPTVYWTESNTPGNGAVAYSDSTGTDSGYVTASWSTTADANKVIQFQYRGIENPFGECWEFDDGVQKYQKAILTSIKVNNIVHYVNHLKDGTGTKTAWTSEDGTSTYWTTTATPGDNSIAYADSGCTVDSGYKTTQNVLVRVDCEMWNTVSVADYTSTDQHTTSSKAYDRKRHYWPSGSWIKRFDPRSFLPRTLGASGSTYLCDNWYNDNGTGSRVVLRGGSSVHGSYAGMGLVHVSYSLTYSTVNLSGRLSA